MCHIQMNKNLILNSYGVYKSLCQRNNYPHFTDAKIIAQGCARLNKLTENKNEAVQ